MANQLRHIGFIADGNRRWAKTHNLPTLEGHKRGSKVVEMIIEELADKGIDFVSFYIFSTENWNRSPEEIKYLMTLITEQITRLTKKAIKNNLRILILGRPERLDPAIWQRVTESAALTEQNTDMTVVLCFNYGGQWEIVDAARKMAAAGDEDYTPDNFQKYLYHPEVPPIDFIVRTSGEKRISGFQLWRAAYAELLFLDKHFPALEASDIRLILEDFSKRQRRFGK